VPIGHERSPRSQNINSSFTWGEVGFLYVDWESPDELRKSHACVLGERPCPKDSGSDSTQAQVELFEQANASHKKGVILAGDVKDERARAAELDAFEGIVDGC
jgi:hypothetical protein